MPRDTLLTLSDTHSTLHAFIAAAIMRARDGAPRTGDTPFYRSNNHSLTNLSSNLTLPLNPSTNPNPNPPIVTTLT